MKKNQKVLIMAEIAILSALAVILDAVANYFSLRLFPQGGSISISMLPIFVIAFRRGLVPGLISGLLLGVLQTLVTEIYVVNALSYILDYAGAFLLVGLAGVTGSMVRSDNHNTAITGIIIGSLIGSFARFLSHFLSGVIFYGEWKWEGYTTAGYSAAYNASFMVPSFILCVILLILLNYTAKVIFKPSK